MKELIFLLMLLMTGIIKADYIPPTLNKLILRADIILYGEVVCMDESVIELNVYNSINHDSLTITIVRFKEWNCGQRWKEYELGDTSLFFLKSRNGRYRTIGGGNEGELPIHNDRIYVHASTISQAGFVTQFDRSDLQMEDNGFNNPYNGYVINLSDFWQATAVVKKCFISEITATGNLINIQQLCSTTQFESTMKQNKILNWVLTDLKK